MNWEEGREENLRRMVALTAVALCYSCSTDPPPTETRTGARFDPAAPRYVVPSEVSCLNCEIELRDIATLGQSADSASVREDAMSRDCMIGRASTGEYVVSGLVGGGRLAVYDEEGRWVRTIGREGEGPGEMGRDLHLMIEPGNTLHVLDNSNHRITSLTLAGELVGSFPVPWGIVQYFAFLPSERFLMQPRPRAVPETGRSLFYVLDREGTEVSSFGTPSDAFELPDLDIWVPRPAADDGFWTGSLWTYEWYRWSAPDSLAWTLMREPEWFPAAPDLSLETLDALYVELPPPPTLLHVWEDGEGLLWSYTQLPDADWESGPSQVPTPDWSRRNFDTMVEVIDLTEKEVVARHRHDELLAPMCQGPLMYTVVYTDGGDTRAKIIRPVLITSDG